MRNFEHVYQVNLTSFGGGGVFRLALKKKYLGGIRSPLLCNQ